MKSTQNKKIQQVKESTFEPTGHYWFNLGQFLSGKNIRFVSSNIAVI